jgi:hypothetical protein
MRGRLDLFVLRCEGANHLVFRRRDVTRGFQKTGAPERMGAALGAAHEDASRTRTQESGPRVSIVDDGEVRFVSDWGADCADLPSLSVGGIYSTPLLGWIVEGTRRHFKNH